MAISCNTTLDGKKVPNKESDHLTDGRDGVFRQT